MEKRSDIIKSLATETVTAAAVGSNVNLLMMQELMNILVHQKAMPVEAIGWVYTRTANTITEIVKNLDQNSDVTKALIKQAAAMNKLGHPGSA